MTAFFAGQEIVADDFDDLINLARMGFRARRVASQAIASGGSNAISWDTEDQDTDGFITVTGTTATIPTGCDGVYAVMARMALSGSPGTGRALLEIVVTSSLAGVTNDYRIGSVNPNESGRLVMTAVLPLAAADSFVVNAVQTSGGSLNLGALLCCYRMSA